METNPTRTAVGSSLSDKLPTHPLVGSVIQRKSGEWKGGAYLVRSPMGVESWMRVSDFAKAVGKATPKDVNLYHPTIKAGDGCVYGRPDGQSYGIIAGVTQQSLQVQDVCDQKTFEVVSVDYLVRPEVIRCAAAKFSGDAVEIARTAAELYFEEQDDLFGPGLSPAPAKRSPRIEVAKSAQIIDFPKTNSMNHLINDRGETVQAVGSPGSIERAQCERPEFVKELASYNADILAKEKEGKTPGQFDEETTVFAAQRLHERGIIAEDEATALLAAAGFKKEIGAPVLRQLQIITQDQERSLRGATLPVPSGPALKSPEISG